MPPTFLTCPGCGTRGHFSLYPVRDITNRAIWQWQCDHCRNPQQVIHAVPGVPPEPRDAPDEAEGVRHEAV